MGGRLANAISEDIQRDMEQVRTLTRELNQAGIAIYQSPAEQWCPCVQALLLGEIYHVLLMQSTLVYRDNTGQLQVLQVRPLYLAYTGYPGQQEAQYFEQPVYQEVEEPVDTVVEEVGASKEVETEEVPPPSPAAKPISAKAAAPRMAAPVTAEQVVKRKRKGPPAQAAPPAPKEKDMRI